MASKKACKSRGRRTRRRRQQRGGNYSSAATYGMHVNGSGPEQYARTFSMDSPYASRVGSEYVGAQGQWSHQPSSATPEQLALIQSAGMRRRMGGTKIKYFGGKRRRGKGGFLGPVISQAIVPATLLALQQTYGRKDRSSNKTFRRRFRGGNYSSELYPGKGGDDSSYEQKEGYSGEPNSKQ